MARRRFGLVKHSPRKVSRAFWRGKPKPARKVGIAVEIRRHEKVKWLAPGVPRVLKGRGEFEAVACLQSSAPLPARLRTGHRCAYGDGGTPTLAFKRAVSKLLVKVR